MDGGVTGRISAGRMSAAAHERETMIEITEIVGFWLVLALAMAPVLIGLLALAALLAGPPSKEDEDDMFTGTD